MRFRNCAKPDIILDVNLLPYSTRLNYIAYNEIKIPRSKFMSFEIGFQRYLLQFKKKDTK